MARPRDIRKTQFFLACLDSLHTAQLHPIPLLRDPLRRWSVAITRWMTELAAVIGQDRRECTLAEDHAHDFFFLCQNSRSRFLRPHRHIMNEGSLFPLYHRLCIDPVAFCKNL